MTGGLAIKQSTGTMLKLMVDSGIKQNKNTPNAMNEGKLGGNYRP